MRRVTCILASFAAAAGFVLYGVPATNADAYEVSTNTWAGNTTSRSSTLPSGLVATVASTGSTTLDTATLGSRGWVASQYTPSTLVTGDQTAAVSVDTAGCAVSGACASRGTLTISFSQPVRNPTIHIAGLGASNSNGSLQSDIHAILDLTTTGATLSKASGSSSFAVTGGTRITTTVGSVSNVCDSTSFTATGYEDAADVAGCGSVLVTGTVSSLQFSMSALFTVNAGATGGYNGGTSTDAFNLTVTVPQDFGDAPATFDPTQAAAHVMSDLTLGSGVTQDNANVRNGTTSPNAGAGASGDTDDAFTSLPNILAGVSNTYTLSVPVSGVSKAAYVCGYIDFDKSGTFYNNTNERACATLASGATSASLSWTVPATTTTGTTYARFRLGYTQSQVQAAAGLADSGEVEDYQVTLAGRPTITLRKTTLGAAGGPFGFTLTNTTQTTGTVTTTAAGTAVQVDGDTTTTGTQVFTISTVNTAATIDETTIPSGWALSSATCTNAAGTTVGTLSGSKYTIPAAATTPGAAFTCDYVNGRPAITLAKTAGAITDNDGNGPDVGDTVAYSFLVTNSGQTPLGSVAVTDAKVGTVSCPATTLAIGATTTCTASYTLTQADVDAGSVANTASVSGTPPTGSAVTASSTATKTITQNPAISLVKSAGAIVDNDGKGPDAGDTVAYSFAVTNSGNVTLTSVAVSDPTVGTVTCPSTTLAPAATTTCTATYTLTQADVNAGSVVNSASVSGTPPKGAAVTATSSKTVTIARTATLTLTKTAGTPTGNTAGSTIAYTFVVKNTGNTTLTAVAVTDAKVASVSCAATTLLPGASTTCTGTHTVTQAEVDAGTVANTATATGTPPSGVSTPTATASATSTLSRTVAITFDKQSSGVTDLDGNGPDAGDRLGYTFLITNTGNVTVNPVSVADSKVATVTCPVTSLAPGASTTCTGSLILTQADFDAGHVYNSATASGVGPSGTWTATATDSVDTTLAVGPAITLKKTAGTPTGGQAGATITYTFVVTNSGNVTLNNIWLQDNKVFSVSCPQTTLAPGGTMTCTAVYTITQADEDAGSVVNSATVSGYASGTGQLTQATAGTTTVLTATPSISVDKQAGTPSGNTVGSTIAYTFLVVNTGNVTLSAVKVTDAKVGTVTCPATSLAPAGSTTCTATYTITQTDIDAGHVANTATASGTPPTGAAVAASDSTDTTITRTAAISLDKQAGTPSGSAAGSTIAYAFVVVNTGNTTLTSVAVTDAKVGTVTCPTTTLAPGATITCVATYAITQADLNAGVVNNTASATGTPPSGLTKPTSSDSTSTTLTRTPAISLAKTAGTPSGNTAGSTIAYTFVVRNTGNVTLTAVNVADAKVGTVTCPATTLAPGATTTCTATYTITQADVDAGTVANTATATGTPPTGLTAPTATSSATAAITAAPKLMLVKTAGTPTGQVAGATIPYSFLVTNTGNVTLHGVAITDALVASVSCPATTLAPGASTTCTGSHTITQAEVNAGTVTNNATASGTPPTGAAVTATGTTTTTLTRTATIAVDKQAGVPSGNTAGSTIAYAFVVTNTGNVTLTSVGVTDAKVGTVTCPATTLAPGASTTCTATYTVTQADVNAGHVANTATATGTPPTGLTKPTASDATDTTVAQLPSLSLDKQAGTPSGTSAGSTIAYTFIVTNTGNVTLTQVGVSDSKVGTLSCPTTTLAPNASTTCTATYALTQADVDAGHVANTATASGTPPAGNAVTAGDSTDTTVGAAPSLTLLKKAGTPTGTTAGSTISYTFLVTNTGNVTLHAVGVSDAKVGAVSCPATTLAPGSSTTCTATYTLTQADVDAGQVVNTATASGTPPTGAPVTGQGSVTVPIAAAPKVVVDKQAATPSGNTAGSTIAYSFVVTNTGNVTLHAVGVSDAKVGAVSCPVTTLAPGASTTCTATYTLTQADVDAGHVANTATVSGTPPTGAAVTGTDSTDTAITAGPAITLDKQAGTPSGHTVGSTIAYTFLVTNAGNVTLTSVGVTDAKVGTVSCPATTLAPGTSTTCTATYTLTQADVDAGSVLNTATASGRPPTGAAVTGTDSTNTSITAGPALTVDKQPGTPSGNTAGATIAYTFLVANTGNVTLHAVGVSDAKVGAVSCPATTLAPGASTTCTASYTLTQADVDAGQVVNTATASGTPPTGAAVTATDTATSSIVAAPKVVVDKQAGTPSGNTAGSTIAYSFVVQNTGNVTLHAVGVSDAKVGTVSCPATMLAPGASTTCTATYTITQADVDAGHVANTATVSGTPPTGAAVTGSDSTDTTITGSPRLMLDKQAGTPSGNTVGSTIAYTFLVSNTGNVSLTSVGVSDPKVGTVSCPATTLAPGASTTCTATYTLTQADVDAGQVVNSATASGTPPSTAPVTASDSTTTPIAAAPQVALDKQAGTPSGTAAGSTIAYTFVVTNTGNVTLHSIAVTDAKVGAVTCPATTLAPNASMTCSASYTLTQADVDAGHVANTATVSAAAPTGVAVTGTDSTDTPITAGPAITLDKQAGTPSGTSAGSTVAYTFVVTNAGNVTLTAVGVTDAKVGTVSCPVTTLAPNASTTCSATYTLTQADVDAGQVVNTATVSGTPPTGAAVTGQDSVTVPITAAPAVSVDKQAGTPSGSTVGSTIAYSFVVQNTGNVTLHAVAVSDAKVGTVSCPVTTLAPGASTTCTATYTLTQADVDAGHVANTATASGTPPTGVAVTGTDSTDTAIAAGPAITLEKQAGAPSGNTAGSTIGYTFLVTNAGNVTLTSIGVSDAKVGAVSCPVTTLSPGASTTCTATYTLTQADVDAGHVANTATASGTAPRGSVVTATDSLTTPVVAAPVVTVDKQAGVPTGDAAGATITYTFLVQNTGNVTLHAVAVSDPKVGTVTCPAASLAPGASTTCTATYTLTQADVDAGHVANTATVSGTPPTGAAVTGTDSTDTAIMAGPAITLDKQAGAPTANTAGATIAYTFVVTNTGNVTLTGVGVTDAKVGTPSCPATSLAPHTSMTCTATYALTQADVDAGVVNNTATASGTPPTGAATTATDSTSTPVTSRPVITVDKQAGTSSGTTAGSTIAYTFVVENTGNVTLTTVGITDAKVGTVSCPATTLAPGASTTCAATYTLTQADVDAGHVANTATATGAPPAGDPVTATDSTDTAIAAGPALTLDKQAGTPSGATVGSTIAYTFLVTNTGNVTLTSVGVSDAKVGTVTCPATTLAPGASTTCTATYTLTQSDVDAGQVVNTATASGTPPTGDPATAVDAVTVPITAAPSITIDKQAGTPSSAAAGATIAYTFLVQNTGNVTLTSVGVSDPKVGAASCPLTTLAPGASMTCTATYTLTQADVDAGVVDNTAAASGTQPTGDPVTGRDSTSTPITAAPSLQLEKQAGVPSGTTAGSTIHYTFVVENTGNVTLTLLEVTDALVGTVCPVTTLAPGVTTTCSATYTITQADVDAGHVVNAATASAQPPSGDRVTASDGTDTAIVAGPGIAIDKQAGTPTGTTAGSTIAYTFVVTNQGNVTLHGIVVNDPTVGTVSCPATVLTPGADMTCTATYALTQADVDEGEVDNLATVSGTPPTGAAVTATDSTLTTITSRPVITLDKQAGTPTGTQAGSTIAYAFVVTNTGNVTLRSVGITDPKVGAASCPTTTLVPGASTTCTATYTLTQADVDAGHVANSASVAGTPPSGAPVTAADSTDTPLAASPSLTLDKQASAPTGRAAGATIQYSFVLQNTGNVTLSAVDVTDAKVGAVSCPVTTLAPGASTTCTATYTLTQSDVDAGAVTNSATASGTPPTGSPVTATDSVTSSIAASPALTLDKRAAAPSGHTAGSTIAYTFEVANTGNVTLTTVGVADAKVGTVTCPATTLAPGVSTTCTATYTITQADVDAGHVPNSAVASGTPPTGAAVTGSDATDTPITATPSLTFEKQAGTPSGATAGSTIAYTFEVTNTGNVTLSAVAVTDAKVGAVTCPATTLEPGESTTCSASYALTQADVDAGHVDNTASVVATPPSGSAVTGSDSTTTPIASAPQLTLDKQAATPTGTAAGSTIAYTFVLQNTGNVTLATVGVTDAKVGAVSCPVTTLAPDASTTCTATYVLTQADVDAGHVANTATASGTPPTGAPATAQDSTDTPITAAPVLTLDKQAGTPTGSTVGSTIAYSFVVANNGNVTLSALGVTDAKVGAVSCPVTTLAPGTSTTCSATYTLTQADVDAGVVDNTATASATPPTGAALTASDSTSTPITASPSLTLDKQAGTPSGTGAGSTIAYSFLVTNTGNVTLSAVGVADAKVGTVSCPVTTLAPGASTTCTATYALTQADVDAGHVENTATATATPPTGAAVTGTDSTDTPIAATPSITLDKQAGTPTGQVAGATIAYTFVVANTGNVTLSNLAVTDPTVGTVTCPATTLAPGQSTTCAATYVLTQADVDAGQVVNTAAVSAATPSGGTVGAQDATTTPITAAPSLTLDKQAGTPSGNTAGSTIAYSFVVQNTGNTTLATLSISDPKVGTVTCSATTLAPGQSTTCTATYVLTQADVDAGTVHNAASATAAPPTGAAVTATDATDTAITAAPSLTLDKQAGTPSGNTAGSTIAYTFVVANTGNVTLAPIGVTDPKVGAVDCSATSLAPGASTTCSATYTVTQADVDAGTVDNTATASGTPPTGDPVTAGDSTSSTIAADPSLVLDKQAGTPSGNTAGATIAYTFLVQNTGNVTLSTVGIDDPLLGPVSCPTATLAPGASTTCAATYTLTQADIDAGHVANSATASGTPPRGAAVTGVDATDTPLTAAPVLTLDKQAGTPSGATAGSTIVYTFLVANAGNVTLSAVGVADAKVGTVACPAATLAPGASMSCTATYTLTQTDVDARAVVNTATASAVSPGGAPLSATDSTSTTITAAAALTLDKAAGTPTSQVAGGTITYTFLVTNTGNVTLSSVGVVDAKTGPVTCPQTTLAPGAATTCTATYTLTQADVDAGHVANTATASGTSAGGAAPAATDSTDTLLTPAPALSLDKQAGTPSGNSAGSTIPYSFLVTNTGTVTLSPVGVSDPKVGAVSCPATSLAPGASTTCTASYTLTQADVDAGVVVNTATAHGNPPGGDPGSPADDATASSTATTPVVAAPGIDLVKTGVARGSQPGSQVDYSLLVTNTGNVTLTSVVVSDPTVGPVDCPVTVLAPGASMTCSASDTLTQSDVDAGRAHNEASVTGTPPVGSAVSDTAAVDVPVTPGAFIRLVKRAGTPSGDTAGSTIDYTFDVTNTGNVTLSDIEVTDPKVGAVSCPATTLAAGASMTCTATYTLTTSDVDAGTVTNVARVTGLSPTRDPADDADEVTTPLAQVPSVALVKSADVASDVRAGDLISYTFQVTNTGNVTLTGLAVSDPMLGAITCPSTTLAPGAAMTCTGPAYTVTKADVRRGRITNEASVTGSLCPVDMGLVGVLAADPCRVVAASAFAVVTTVASDQDGDNDGDGNLAYTGFGGGQGLLYGGGILAAGVLLVLVGRRRKA
ncbi:MAG: GEVED domain-containing protein [Propionicimonas sp.]|uniref:DUF7507 domain-containing protein n=1 Tax=Propionicimonas sp. TaxID=1955623 RepID=UPI003D0987FB